MRVFSDSVLRVGMQAMSDATGNLNRRWADKRSQGGSATSSGHEFSLNVRSMSFPGGDAIPGIDQTTRFVDS